MQGWEKQIIELKSSLKAKDKTIQRLKRCIELYKREFARREHEYEQELCELREKVALLKKERRSIRKKVKHFIQLKQKEMKVMRRELRLLERQQMVQRYYNEQQQQQQQLQSNSSTTSSQPSEKDNGSKEYLRQLEKEYIAQIDKYKELLKYESDRLKHTRQEFLEYVHDKTREIENLQQQIRYLKEFVLSTNCELNTLTKVLPGGKKKAKKNSQYSSSNSQEYGGINCEPLEHIESNSNSE
jgi:chromosome segregation ATPase